MDDAPHPESPPRSRYTRPALAHAVASSVAMGCAAIPLAVFLVTTPRAGEAGWLILWAAVTGVLGGAAGGALETSVRGESESAHAGAVVIHRLALALAGLLALGQSIYLRGVLGGGVGRGLEGLGEALGRAASGPTMGLGVVIAAMVGPAVPLPLVMSQRLLGRTVRGQVFFSSIGSASSGLVLTFMAKSFMGDDDAFARSPLLSGLWVGLVLGGLVAASIGGCAGVTLPLALRLADRFAPPAAVSGQDSRTANGAT